MIDWPSVLNMVREGLCWLLMLIPLAGLVGCLYYHRASPRVWLLIPAFLLLFLGGVATACHYAFWTFVGGALGMTRYTLIVTILALDAAGLLWLVIALLAVLATLRRRLPIPEGFQETWEP